MSAHNTMKKPTLLSVPEKQAQGRPKKDTQERQRKAESNTKDKLSDGYFNMVVIALWCLDPDNYTRWCDRIPNERAVSGITGSHLKDMNHWERQAKESKKKVKCFFTLLLSVRD
ncbi:hypothetical protein DFH28DRAFT_929165 [Melampsora americana]|nr:hypothetical protein DFH28DRAFT_929165 [Melampsora americana]